MQLKVKIGGVEELTLTSFSESNFTELKDLFALFGELLPDTTAIRANFLDHATTESHLVFNQRVKRGKEMKPTGYDYRGDVKKTAKTEVDKLSDMIKTTLPKEEQLEVVIHNLVAEVANLKVANEALQDSVDWEKL